MDSRSKNGVRNVFAGFINRIVLIILPFITRTAIVYTLGSEYLGLSNLFTSILMVLNLSELGFGSALVYSMYKPVADNDTATLKALLNFYKRIYRIVGLGLLLVGAIVSLFLPKIIKGDVPGDVNLYVLYFMFLANTSISYFVYAHKKALLIAYQRNDILSNVSTIITIISYSIQIGVLILFHNYYLYVLVFLVSTIADNLYSEYFTRRMYPEIVCEGECTDQEKKAIYKHVKGIALQKLCSSSRNTFSSIAISMFLGLKSIAIYGNYYYIMSAVHDFLYQIPNNIRSTVGNSVAKDSQEKNYKDFNAMCLIYAWITGVCTVCLCCLFQPFMKIWMGEEMMMGMPIVVLLCLYFTILSFADILALYKDAAGLWWQGRYRVIIEAVTNIVLCFTLGKYFGVAGIIAAPIITLALISHCYGGYIVFKYYFTEQNFGIFMARQLLYISIVAFISFITYYICDFLPTEGFIDLISRLFVSLMVSNVLFYIILRHTNHYELAKMFAVNIYKSMKK